MGPLKGWLTSNKAMSVSLPNLTGLHLPGRNVYISRYLRCVQRCRGKSWENTPETHGNLYSKDSRDKTAWPTSFRVSSIWESKLLLGNPLSVEQVGMESLAVCWICWMLSKDSLHKPSIWSLTHWMLPCVHNLHAHIIFTKMELHWRMACTFFLLVFSIISEVYNEV